MVPGRGSLRRWPLASNGLPLIVAANFEVVWDADKAVMQKYGVEKVPESFLVGRDGKLLRKVTGVENWNSPDAIEFFKLLLAKKAAHP